MEHTITLTDEDKNNLITFLMRVPLKGEEVPAYVKIVAALNKEFLDSIKENPKNDII